jgi:hypothetical protein
MTSQVLSPSAVGKGVKDAVTAGFGCLIYNHLVVH